MVAVANTTSLSLVREEVEATLGQVEVFLETYIADPDSGQHIESALGLLDQVRGVFKLIQIPAPEALAEEMLEVGRHLVANADLRKDKADACLTALSSGLFVMSRYLEYVLRHKQMVPVLLVPAINDLRRARGAQPVPESHFYAVSADVGSSVASGDRQELAKVAADSRRLRQMYQVGLLGVLRGGDPAMSLQMMSRAMQRVDRLCRGYPIAPLWWASSALLKALTVGGLELTATRKALLARIEKYLKQLVYKTEPTVNAAAPSAELREIVFICSLADTDDPDVTGLLDACGRPELDFSEASLKQERNRLSGPGGAVLRSVSAALKEEITQAKHTVDLSSRIEGDTDFEKLIKQMRQIAETLSMLQLERGRRRMLEQIDNLQRWQDEKQPPSHEELSVVADVLLYVDSAIIALEAGEGGPEGDALDNEDEVIAFSQLDDATAAVVKEIQAGLALARQGIQSFMESGFDTGHLGNVPSTLEGVNGGLIVIGQQRAARVTVACAGYLKEKLIGERLQPSQEQLETLADALTSLEYFIEGMASRKQLGDTILDVAEESMKELGYPV